MRVRVLRGGHRGGSSWSPGRRRGRLGPCQERLWITRDETCPTLKSHVGPYPGQHNEYTVTKANEEEEVYGHPGHPGEEPGELEPPQIRYCGGASDRCQGALVSVLKGYGGL